MNKSMTSSDYSLLIVSPIPVSLTGNQYHTLDLWVEDIKINLKYVKSISIVCPKAVTQSTAGRALPESVKVIFREDIRDERFLSELIKNHDIVSVGVGNPIWRMRTAMDVAKMTIKLKRFLITSITSNRSKTTIMNAHGKGWLKKIKAHLTAWSISHTTLKLVKMSDGVLVIGEGVKKSMQIEHTNLYVETASWINSYDVIEDTLFSQKLKNFSDCSRLRMIIATRLEYMKGVHVGINALIDFKHESSAPPTLTIIGQGPELNNLKALVQDNHLQDTVTFEGVLSYPDAFFEKIRQYHLMLLTNLNEEQPRLIFDAISQGLIPVCPSSTAYQGLGLPEEVFYETGDSNSLMRKITELQDTKLTTRLLNELRPLAFKYTIDSMHCNRANWIKNSQHANDTIFI